MTKNKTMCPITRNTFALQSTPLHAALIGMDSAPAIKAAPRLFSSGSVGWFIGGKAAIGIKVGDKVQKALYQVSINVTAVGSKDLPAEQLSIEGVKALQAHAKAMFQDAPHDDVSGVEFLAYAKPIAVKLGDRTITATPREFSTGSVGYFYSGKEDLSVGKVQLKCQVCCIITLIGSHVEPAAAPAPEVKLTAAEKAQQAAVLARK